MDVVKTSPVEHLSKVLDLCSGLLETASLADEDVVKLSVQLGKLVESARNGYEPELLFGPTGAYSLKNDINAAALTNLIRLAETAKAEVIAIQEAAKGNHEDWDWRYSRTFDAKMALAKEAEAKIPNMAKDKEARESILEQIKEVKYLIWLVSPEHPWGTCRNRNCRRPLGMPRREGVHYVYCPQCKLAEDVKRTGEAVTPAVATQPAQTATVAVETAPIPLPGELPMEAPQGRHGKRRRSDRKGRHPQSEFEG